VTGPVQVPVQVQAQLCRDPDCRDATGARSIAEPEQDGDLCYLACLVCGYEFGYRNLTTTPADRPADGSAEPVKAAGTCPVGIPDAVRRRALPDGPAPPLPLLQIGRRG
jgi:hypothetical protein